MSRLLVKNGSLYRALGSTQSVPRVMRGSPVPLRAIHDVDLAKRDIATDTLEGLGSLGGDTLGWIGPGTAAAAAATEVAADARQPINPYPEQGVKLAAPGVVSPKAVVASMSRTTMIVAAIAGIGLVYYLSRKR